jgi:hypothetical protein
MCAPLASRRAGGNERMFGLARATWIASRNPEQPERHGLEVLHDGSEMELVAGAGETPEPHAFEAVMRL